MPPDQQSGSGLAMLAALAGRAGGGSSSIGPSPGGGALGAGGALGNVAGDLLGLKTSGALFIDMLDGPTIQDNMIRRFDLRGVYWDRYWADARKDLADRTEVKQDRKSGVITIAVSDRDPIRAQQMAQAYIEELNRTIAEVSTSSARRERMFLEQRLVAVKQNLDSAAREFSDFASKNGILDVPSQNKAMLEAEGKLQGQLIAAQSELDGLKQIYTENNIRVRTLQARVAGLKKEVENMSGNRADPNSETSKIAGDFPSFRRLPLMGVQWANLYRESKIQETVYELLTQEYEFSRIQEAKEIPTLNVLDAPMAPEQKYFPPRALIAALGGLLSLVFGGMFVIGSASWAQNESPEKKLATQIWSELRSSLSQPAAMLHKFWSRIGGRNGSGTRPE
jgi:capsule polysaccharide export protein KpsE/RkpR